jgi:thiamine pyrophosphokinase
MVDFVNQRITRTADRSIFAARKDDADAALALRAQMEARNESVGPRQPDIRILGSSGERLD